MFYKSVVYFFFAIIIFLQTTVSYSADRNCKQMRLKIAVDIGHSKFDRGATSATGKSEYSFNKRFVTEFLGYSKEYPRLDLFVINQTGRKISLVGRINTAAEVEADIFISFHHDSVNPKYLKRWEYKGRNLVYSDQFKGYSVFVSTRNKSFKKSFELAKKISIGFKSKGLDPTLHHAEPIRGENRKLLSKKLGVYDVPFAVLKAPMPSVLIELGVIVNRQEEKLLETLAHRKKLSIAVLKVLQDFCLK